MNQQPDLFGPSQPLSRHRAGHSTAQHIEELTTQFRTRHGLTAKTLKLKNLHITLHYFGEIPDLPQDLIQTVDRACATVANNVPSFEISLNQIASFPSRRDDTPFVLLGK
jgi:2'-5' RNA ligase